MSKVVRAARRVAQAEQRVTHRAARREDGIVMRAAGNASELADQPPLIALSLATLAVGAVARRPGLARIGARMLAGHLIATGIKTMLKSSIDRTRPSRALEEEHRWKKGDGAEDTSLNSFPSGHTAGAVAVAQAVAADAPLAALPLQAAALGVAALQPSRGKHYWSDVLAGAVIGWASERVARTGLRIAENTVRRALTGGRRVHGSPAHAEGSRSAS